MDEKENKLNEELAAENKNETAEAQQPQENETSLEEKDGVKYETNDNWKFDAEAPTLNNDMFEGIDESAYDIQKNSAQNNKVPEKYVYSNDSDNIVGEHTSHLIDDRRDNACRKPEGEQTGI